MIIKSEQTWREIRRGSAAIVLASQRDSGLWALASGPHDVPGTHARDRGAEVALREQESFGYEAITTTWCALRVVLEVFDEPPRRALYKTVDALLNRRAANGAFGTWRDGFHIDRKINESPRHSAMALLCLLQSADHLDPKPRFYDCRETIEWLLNVALASGGWAYEPQGSVEPISTAAVITALCLFTQYFDRDLMGEQELVEKVNNAISHGFATLMAMRGTGLWPNLSVQTQVADSAFIVELLCLALSKSNISQIVPRAKSDVSGTATRLVESSVSDGWAQRDGGGRASFTATLFSLHTVLLAMPLGLAGDLDQRWLSRVKDNICRTVQKGDIWLELKAWDWIQIARLSNLILQGAPDQRLNSVPPLVGELTKSTTRLALTRQSVRVFPKFSRLPLLYLLTYGRADVPSGALERAYRKVPSLVRLFIESIPAVIVGYILGWIIGR